MKTNKQKQIKVSKSGFRRSRFNWTHDVNTTFSWGEVQPTQCKLLIPGSKTTMSAQNLIRLAPMVAPTFGRVKYKTFNQFVSMEEVFPNFAELMAQEPVYRISGGVKVPQTLPHARLGILSSWVLHGARATLYYVDPSAPNPAQEAAAGHYRTQYRTKSGATWTIPSGIAAIQTAMANAGIVSAVSDPYGHSMDASMPDVGTRIAINLTKLNLGIANVAPVAQGFSGLEIVTAAESTRHFVPVTQSYTPGVTNDFYALTPIDQEVTFDSADYVIEGSFTDNGTTYYVAFAFELSDFGKRIRKILQGCGYQINFAASTEVSILPLIAQYKAYFDVFGLQLYQGWETTWIARWIERFAHGNIADMSSYFEYNQTGSSIQAALDGWHIMITELGQEFYTEQPDFIGSHMEKLAVSPNVDPSGFISVDINGVLTGAHISNTATAGTNGVTTGQQDLETTTISNNPSNAVHSYIDSVYHGEVDAEVLKRIYKWTNRNTILGREIAKILRAQGLGKFVDECKSNFIGATDNLVTISDVVSMATTSEAVLGEYGGRGLQYTNDKTLVFENDEYGYWVTLACIVPDAGYTQGLDTTLTSLKKFDLYNPDFDAIGMELTPKHAVVDTNYCVLDNAMEMNASDTGFGFVPRYSKFKVAQNLVNGDFNRHGMRATYLPYTLDRQLNVNDYRVASEVHDTVGGTEFTAVELDRSTRVGALPVAGNIWRMPTKYAWMGNFDRIFYNVGLRESEKQNLITPTMLVGFADYNSDNFLSHGIYDVQCYAPMKPIEDSYGLEEDEPDKAGADFVTKA